MQQRTASNHSMEDCLDPGINWDASSRQLSSLQVARIYKYLQARKFKDGSVRLIGTVGIPISIAGNQKKWQSQGEIQARETKMISLR